MSGKKKKFYILLLVLLLCRSYRREEQGVRGRCDLAFSRSTSFISKYQAKSKKETNSYLFCFSSSVYVELDSPAPMHTTKTGWWEVV